MKIKTSLALLVPLALLSSCSLSSNVDGQESISQRNISFTEEDKLLTLAQESYQEGLYSIAIQQWNNLIDNYPASPYVELAELKIADSHFYGGNYEEAINAYLDFSKIHPQNKALPYIHFQMGNSMRLQFQGLGADGSPLIAASKHYRKLIEEYPSTLYSAKAKVILDECMEKLAENEAFVAKYYLKQKEFEASASRVLNLFRNFPRTKAAKTIAHELKAEYPDEFSILIQKLDYKKL